MGWAVLGGTTVKGRATTIESYLRTVAGIVSELPVDLIDDIVQTIKRAYEEGKQVLLCGNGGSAATATHLAEDLQKGIGSLSSKRFRAMALTDSAPLLTAWANDTDYSRVFAEQVATWASPGDVLVAISGSGNSPNVLRAVETANGIGVTTIGVTGMGGGALAKIAQTSLIVPSDNMQQVEDVHLVLGHLIFTCLYEEISGCA